MSLGILAIISYYETQPCRQIKSYLSYDRERESEREILSPLESTHTQIKNNVINCTQRDTLNQQISAPTWEDLLPNVTCSHSNH